MGRSWVYIKDEKGGDGHWYCIHMSMENRVFTSHSLKQMGIEIKSSVPQKQPLMTMLQRINSVFAPSVDSTHYSPRMWQFSVLS